MADSPPLRKKVFISYSHADKNHLKQLRTQLVPYVRTQHMDVWDDTRITNGRWGEEIRQAIASAKVAVLLVSADFLASEFIANHELPPLLEAAKHEGLQIFQVILSHCAFRQSGLFQYQALNPPEKPLSKMLGWERQKIWAELAAHIAAALAPVQEEQDGGGPLDTSNPETRARIATEARRVTPAPVLVVQAPAPVSSEPAVVAADVTWVGNCLSDLTREELRHLVTFLTKKPPDRDIANSEEKLREKIREVAAGDANSVNQVRQFAEAFELADVLAYLSDKHQSEGLLLSLRKEGGVGAMPNNENRDEQRDKLLTYLRCLQALHQENRQNIRSLTEAFNYGRPAREQAHSLQSLATLMAKDESNFELVMSDAKRLLSPATFATFQVNIGVKQEAALVREFMHPLPERSFFPPTATVAALEGFFMGIEVFRYFVVRREVTNELVGMLSISDFSPNRAAIERMPKDTLATSLRYFRREVETLRDTDTMDLAQQKFEEHLTLTYLFVVNEARQPIGLLSKEDDLERWRTSRLG